MEFLAQTLRDELPLIVGARVSFIICLIVLVVLIFGLVRAIKAQEIANLKSQLDLKSAEISEYRRKLGGASPDQAKERIDALEAELDQRIKLLEPRVLTDASLEAVRLAAAEATGTIYISNNGQAADAGKLADQLASAFQRAGWRVERPTVLGVPNPPLTDLRLTIPPSDEATPAQLAAAKAIHACGLPYTTVPPPFSHRPPRFERPAGAPDFMFQQPEWPEPQVEVLVTYRSGGGLAQPKS